MLRDVFDAWRAGRRPWLATLTCLLTVAVAGVWHEPADRAALVRLGDVYAGQPLRVELARVPASVLFPI